VRFSQPSKSSIKPGTRPAGGTHRKSIIRVKFF
jgi:hypothetical protein